MVAQGVDTGPVLAALARNADLWDQDPIRTAHPNSAHVDASDILVFYGATKGSWAEIVNDVNAEPQTAWGRIPQLRPLVLGLMAKVEGTRLGRVVISRLPPGKSITPHEDAGAPVHVYSRYQLMLQSLPGVQFRCGTETLNARTGDCFWFENKQVHSVVNNSADDRIALLMDIQSA